MKPKGHVERVCHAMLARCHTPPTFAEEFAEQALEMESPRDFVVHCLTAGTGSAKEVARYILQEARLIEAREMMQPPDMDEA